jgi:hypothetical protein
MPGCCDPQEYDAIFTRRYARRTAKSYRTSGLDDTAGLMVDDIVARGVKGATVLEIGGGVGALHVELLRRGASSATNVELSTTYEAEADKLLSESQMRGRVRRLTGNVATGDVDVPSADIVVLHRVVCCYADFGGLLGAAAEHSRRVVAFSYPRTRWLNRAGLTLENVSYAVRGCAFRSFVHSPEEMVGTLVEAGFEPADSGRTRWWEYTVAAGSPAS